MIEKVKACALAHKPAAFVIGLLIAAIFVRTVAWLIAKL